MFSVFIYITLKVFLVLLFPVETNALQCYHCGTNPVLQKPILLGVLTRDPSYDNDAYEVPTCNYFNTSLSEYVITCQPDEKGCLKGWVTQVNYIYRYSELSNKHAANLILFENIFPPTCLIRTYTFIYFLGKFPPTRLL